MMNWNIEKKDGKLFITITLEHIKTSLGSTRSTVTTFQVLELLKDNNIFHGDLISEATAYNYQTLSKCTGTWVFSLPLTKKTKKTTQPIENKETVIKMNSKKTIKK